MLLSQSLLEKMCPQKIHSLKKSLEATACGKTSSLSLFHLALAFIRYVSSNSLQVEIIGILSIISSSLRFGSKYAIHFSYYFKT